jgi:hypothetical protein
MVCWDNPGLTLPVGGDYIVGLCENYCSILMDGSSLTPCPGGSDEAFPSVASCIGACLSFPILSTVTNPLTPAINLTYSSGDSFECRRHWALQAVFDAQNSKAAAVPNDCIAAGNFGGDIIGPGFGSTICGDACMFYCDEMNGPQDQFGREGHCVPAVFTGGYASWSACYSSCKTNLYSHRAGLSELTDYTLLVTTDTLDCRAVYAGLAGTATTAGELFANCTASTIASLSGTCAAASSTGSGAKSSSTGAAESSSGLSAATSVQVSASVLLVACIAAFFGSRRV